MDALLLSVLMDIGKKVDYLCDSLGFPVDNDKQYNVWCGSPYNVWFTGNIYDCLSYISSQPKQIKLQISIVDDGQV